MTVTINDLVERIKTYDEIKDQNPIDALIERQEATLIEDHYGIGVEFSFNGEHYAYTYFLHARVLERFIPAEDRWETVYNGAAE